MANPNNSLASLTFKNQYWLYTGDLPNADKQDNYLQVFQPVFPFPLGETDSGGSATFFVRPGIPYVVKQPVYDVKNSDYDHITSLGDIGFDIGYGVTEEDGFISAFGMVGTLPTATDEKIAGKQVRLGPEFLIGRIGKDSVYGLFPSHQWDVGGWSGKNYSTTQLQYVYKYLPGGGWNIGTAPIMQYNWTTNEWTIPLQFAVSRTVKMGNTPVKIEVEINYYVEQPDAFGPEWMFGLNITPVVNNFVESWIRGN